MTKNNIEVPSSKLPHGNEKVLFSGNLVNPTKALLLLHGRGATAVDILSITPYLNIQDDVLVLAPQAADNTWYPRPFTELQDVNQPNLNSSIERISTLISFLDSEFKISAEQIALAGFSQGACLVSEYVKHYPKIYLAVAIYSGGFIGEDREVNQQIAGSLGHTPIYIGCDQEDFHIPKLRVSKTAEYLSDHGADVTLRFYSNFGHIIHSEGVDFLKDALSKT